MIELRGRLRPRIRTVPPSVTSAVDETVALAASCRLHLDPWQRLVLEHSLGEGADGRWSAFEVALVVPRQNGKGAVLEARELAGLFLFGEHTIMHSAHEFKTAADHFRRMSTLIKASPTLNAQVAVFAGSHGSERIELKPTEAQKRDGLPGSRLLFVARTGGSGRGFPADLVVLDEAYNLTPAAMSALVPTLTTSPNPQIWYASSSVNQEIHPNGNVLARVRRRGIKGDERLCYLEWSLDEDEYHAAPERIIIDPSAWARSNPALGTSRLSLDYVRGELGALSTQGFAVERLGVGDWPDESAGEQVIPLDVWGRLVSRPTTVAAPLVFAIDVPPNRSTASFATCRYVPPGVKFVEVLPRPDTAPRGTGWVLAEARRLHERWQPTAWIVDRLGPASTLVDDLGKRYVRDGREMPGLPVQVTDGTEMAVACGAFYDDVMSGQLRHGDQRPITMALRAATTRKLLDRWAWNRVGLTDISPLVAVTLARYGLVKHGTPKVVATPIQEHSGPSETYTDDLATISF